MGKRLKKIRKAVRKRLKKRAKDKAPALAAILQRIERIEHFLEPDLSDFYAKEQAAVEPLAATVGTG